MAGIGSAGSSGSSMGVGSPPEVQGANTFSSLKSLFKPQYATCKHCGKQFTPKMSTGIKNTSEKQKVAAAINAAKNPSA